MKRPVLAAMAVMILTHCMSQEKKFEPKDTEVWAPVPAVVVPGQPATAAPSDALILFDGKDLSKWVDKNGKTPEWILEDGAMTVVKGKGDIRTREVFGDVQLHIEWRTPATVRGEGQGRGNSGIFFCEKYELQVLDSYNSKTYPNGQAGSIYKQTIPLVNASRGPGEWQTYDVVFIMPRFNADGSLQTAGRITVFHNGVLIHHHQEIKGTTEYIGPPKIIAHGEGSLRLQDHGDPVSFRNIWLRKL